MRPALFLTAVAMAGLITLPACRTAQPAVVEVTDAVTPVYVPPPPQVYERLDQLGPSTFAGVRWGVDDAGMLREALGLDRYDVREANWGASEEAVPVLEVRTARRMSTTAFLLDTDDGTLRSVVVRDLQDFPPPQGTVFGLLPYLEAFPGKIQIYVQEVEEDTGERPFRFLFFPGLGVKIGLYELDGGTWYVDHVEYFDPEWGMEKLNAYKYGGRLEAVGTITPAERR